MRKRIPYFFVLSVSILLFAFKSDPYFEISKHIEIFTTVYKKLQTMYVDKLNPGELMQTGIKAMLKQIDPYTVYYPEAMVEKARIEKTSSYGNVGLELKKINNKTIISKITDSSPASKSKLKVGDILLKLDGNSIKEKSVQEIQELLKGTIDSEISITTERNQPKSIKITDKLVRKVLQTKSIPFYGSFNEDIGYIKLNSFTRNCANEFKTAFTHLKDSNAIKSLVIDLRGNPGGLLNEAVDLCNIFIPKDKLVVFTKGKLKENSKVYKTNKYPVDTVLPIVVLVNEKSASASEIISGTFQDYDRAVVLGKKTYGKGLVQQTVKMPYNSQLKVTIAKYYTPSGRCVQAIDYSLKNKSKTKLTDRKVFYTNNGRKVHDSDGVTPDISTLDKENIDFIDNLKSSNLIFEYAIKYINNLKNTPEIEDFHCSDSMFSDFVSFLNDKKYDFDTDIDQSFTNFNKVLKSKKSTSKITDELIKVKEEIQKYKSEKIIANKTIIKGLLFREIGLCVFSEEQLLKKSLSVDEEIIESEKILIDNKRYAEILKK